MSIPNITRLQNQADLQHNPECRRETKGRVYLSKKLAISNEDSKLLSMNTDTVRKLIEINTEMGKINAHRIVHIVISPFKLAFHSLLNFFHRILSLFHLAVDCLKLEIIRTNQKKEIAWQLPGH